MPREGPVVIMGLRLERFTFVSSFSFSSTRLPGRSAFKEQDRSHRYARLPHPPSSPLAPFAVIGHRGVSHAHLWPRTHRPSIRDPRVRWLCRQYVTTTPHESSLSTMHTARTWFDQSHRSYI